MIVPNVVVSIKGEPKSGKTHFALTFPAPIFVASFDLGTQFVANKFPGKQIDIVQYPTALVVDIVGVVQACQDVYKKVAEDYRAAVEADYQTLVIDTGTALWEIIRTAFTEERESSGGSRKPGALEYVEPNRRMAAFFTLPQILGKNLVVTSHLKEKWEGGVATGQFILDGFKKTEAYADVCLTIEMKGQKEKSYTEVVVTDNRYDRVLNGETMRDATYNDLLALLGVAQ